MHPKIMGGSQRKCQMKTCYKYFVLFVFGMIPDANALTVCAPVSNCTSETQISDTPDWMVTCGVDNAKVKGLGICSGNIGDFFNNGNLPPYVSATRAGKNSNSHCYCQVIYPYRSKWIYMGQITFAYGDNPIYDPDEDEYACHNECAQKCAEEFMNSPFVTYN